MPNNQNDKSKDFDISKDKSFRKQLTNVNKLIGRTNLSLYGTDRSVDDIDILNKKFQEILKTQIGDITNRDTEDITSFLSQIVSSDNKNTASSELLANQFMSIAGDENGQLQSFIYDAYRNRFLEQSDLHEVASQLIELNEAILITRDAIVSADVVEGRMSCSFKFDNIDENDVKNNVAIIENMEKKFKLREKIKNFIVPKTLEYGNYYVYVIPYSVLFDQFMRQKEQDEYGRFAYRESTLMESFEDEPKGKFSRKKEVNEDTLNYFIESTYKKYMVQEETKYAPNKANKFSDNIVTKEEFSKDLKNMLGNITVVNEPVPIPVVDEGEYTLEYVKEMTEKAMTEANKSANQSDMFNSIVNAKITNDGIIFDNRKTNKKKNEFKDIQDCYLKMMDPTRVLPIKIMSTTIGYYYIEAEDITPLSGAVSNTLYYSKFDNNSREASVIDAIADQVVKAFDKPFLKKNIKFKKTIVDCIQHYNLNEKKLKFQFIPAEYMQEFKIDEDTEGNGTSMIKKSLFYAKLYLMLLLFKIMSIILNSNDVKVNYVKQSGIDKNVANKVQEIARIRQSKQINITDLFSYTTLINKVGNGSEMYVPVGRSGERPIETDILQGQDVQLNSDLLEMLKNAYILGTGVPAAIVNYMQEADFAKVVEQNNTKFNGRVVNYQLDFNSGITELYKKLMRWGTNINESIIDNFNFILQPPKSVAINTKSELIGQFQTLSDFLAQLLYEDPAQSVNAEEINAEIREFKKLLARDQLSMIDMDHIEEIVAEAKIKVKEENLKPKASNGDSGDDDGLDMELDNMTV